MAKTLAEEGPPEDADVGVPESGREWPYTTPAIMLRILDSEYDLLQIRLMDTGGLHLKRRLPSFPVKK